MRKESVQKFDLEAAFKALDTVEIPTVKGIRPNREDLQEKFTRKLVTDILVEDYYDVGDTGELEQAQEEREAEVAKAKLARIEKIVDLDAETEDDILPSYVGKFIMQCPQCMTLFYKNEEDIERSEEAPDVVNINEPCQHCGNSSGYTLIGKVGTVGEEEAAQYDVDDFEENELDLNFDEEEASAEEPAEAEEVATEEEPSEDTDLDLDLAPIEDEEEEVQESLSLREAQDAEIVNVDKPLDEATINISKAEMEKLDKEVEEATKEVAKYNIPMKAQKNSAGQTESVPDFEAVPEAQREAAKKAYDRYSKAIAARPDRAKNIIKYTDESLTEDVELNKQMDLYNQFIKYLQKMVEQDEDALEEAKKLGNKEVIAAIEKRLANSKAELKAALPATVQDEVVENDLPTPEEADMGAAAENKDEPKEKKESLTEATATTSRLKRNYSATELMVKELKTIEPFNKLSTRTIQRVLLPYYIENMGREDLSTQALVDFFEYEGFAPYVLDHFFTMDPLARKELLKADEKFMQIFNDYATAYNFFPGKDETLEPGESEFDYAFNIIFDIDADGLAHDTELTRNTIKSLSRMYAEGRFDNSLIVEELTEDAAVDVLFDSEEFKTPISDAEIDKIRAQYEGLEEDIAPGIETELAINNIVDTWESVEDFDDETFNKLTENYLTNVYSNVKAFKATSCDLRDHKLVVEGIITFNSGKTKSTTFEYEAKVTGDKQLVLEGLNADFASEKAFMLNCKVDTENRLIVESLNYKYTINDTLVEGLLK